MRWSRVDKPDMVKITNPSLLWDNGIEWWYRSGAIVWNKSTADTIRYTKVTGILVWGSDHTRKWESIIWNIDNLVQSGLLNQYEILVLWKIKIDLLDALK